MKLEKISNIVLYALSGLIVLSFLAFFLFGYDNMEGEHNAPKLTGFLLVVQYLLTIGAFAAMLWSVVVSAKKSSGINERLTTGVPGKKIILFATSATVISFIIGLLLGLGEEEFVTSSGMRTPGYMVTLVDVFMWSIYILSTISVVAVVVSATGVLAKKNKKN